MNRLGGAAMDHSSSSAEALRLGDWVFEPRNYLLRRSAQTHSLDPKECAVLVELVSHAPDVVTVGDLEQVVWPEVVVGDNALRQVISRLRKIFGDDSRDPRYIETLHKRGYRLIAPVAAVTATESGASPGHAASPRSGRATQVVLAVVACGLLATAYLSTSSNGTAPDQPRAVPSVDDDRGQAPVWSEIRAPSGTITIAIATPAFSARDALLERLASNATRDLETHLRANALVVADSGETAPSASSYHVQKRIESTADGHRLSVSLQQGATGQTIWSATLDGELTEQADDGLPAAPQIAKAIEELIFIDQQIAIP